MCSQEGVEMRQSDRFKRGSGCFNCAVCGRQTRDTGDNGDLQLCPEDYEIAGIENQLSDHPEAPEGDRLEWHFAIDRLQAEIDKKSGKAPDNFQKALDQEKKDKLDFIQGKLDRIRAKKNSGKSLTLVKASGTLQTVRQTQSNRKGDNAMKTATAHAKKIVNMHKAGKTTGEIAVALKMKRDKASRRAIRTVLAKAA